MGVVDEGNRRAFRAVGRFVLGHVAGQMAPLVLGLSYGPVYSYRNYRPLAKRLCCLALGLAAGLCGLGVLWGWVRL